MFARTLSFWRRLVSGEELAPVGAGTTAVKEDRRLWVRYRADVPTPVQLNAPAQPQRVTAQIRDISIGGANIVADRPFQPGQVLCLELSGNDDSVDVVLACVVRAAPLGGSRWSLGCVFARELARADLAKYGARAVTGAGADQRVWKRYECQLTARYTRIGDEAAPPAGGRVLNISASGIGLQLSAPVEPGTLLNLTLHRPDGQPVRTILACVVHSTWRTNGEVAVGCNFIRELAEEELRALV